MTTSQKKKLIFEVNKYTTNMFGKFLCSTFKGVANGAFKNFKVPTSATFAAKIVQAFRGKQFIRLLSLAIVTSLTVQHFCKTTL